ncbi:MAG TPA: potassium-transporting ATPase subunit KdpA [Chloroflexota bacterium]|nr:potassium-transporting ATPase subunit KdpA [Chloroflexota bacterium]
MINGVSLRDLLQVALFFLLLLATAQPLGRFIARVMAGERTFMTPALGPLERGVYRLCGIDPAADQRWTAYAAALLLFNLAGLLLSYLVFKTQQWLPWNDQGFGPLAPDLAFNTAVSFATNTNWQSYSGEGTVSNFTQMVGLAVHNFTSAATGIAVAVALARGLARRSASGIGNFWADLVRATLYLLLPVSLVFALVLIWQGVPQTLSGTVGATTVEGARQTITFGPMGSQEAIKELGTNGGGFLNANSAHPFEGPSPAATFLQIVSIFLIPSALALTFGYLVGDARQGWAVWAAMATIFALGLAVALFAEQQGNPILAGLGVDQVVPGGSMEGKEVRFGVLLSVLFAVVTTAASCGAVNMMHGSMIPMGGFVPLLNIQLGEVVFGGAGAGLYGMLIFAVLAVFLAGLMVGRTPEYLGKKIEAFDVKMAMLTVLVLPLSILGFTALAVVQPGPLGSLANPGAHGFAEVLYAYTSGTGNNGSAFAGLSANTLYYNTTIGLAMLIGRYGMIVPILALAGSLAAKKRLPVSLGTFPTSGPLFVGLLVGTVLIVGALTYFPALSLGPIVEQLQLNAGQTVEAAS